MIVAHLGPASAQQGGPAGYLAQLSRAVSEYGAGGHTVLFPSAPPGDAPAAPAPARSWRTPLRRMRLTWLGPPVYGRPKAVDLVRLGGPMNDLIAASGAGVRAQAAPSLDQALQARADVLFAHEAPAAEAALERRARGQQVWLLMHSPMPMALYLAWCWGVPERSWDEVRAFPDVQAWMARELAVVSAVDRVLIPCPEAVSELVRVHSRFDAPLARAWFLATGAAAPPRRAPAPDRHRLRARWGLPAAAPVGLFLGNAQPYRGLDILQDALRLLPGRRRLPGAVAVAGSLPDLLAFHPRLRALGPVREVGDLLAAVDFVINVNRFSLFDLSTIESLEAGRPLLLSPVGGNLAFRDLGAGAEMLDDVSPAAVARGLTTMFQMAPETRDALARQSRQCYEAHLTPRHLRDRHVAVYDHVASARSAGA